MAMAFIHQRLVPSHPSLRVLPTALVTVSALRNPARLFAQVTVSQSHRHPYWSVSRKSSVQARVPNVASRRRSELSALTMRNASSLTKASRSKERILILGSGWAGYVLSRHLSPDRYHITVISPRSYFVFTPLLNDTAVGTLEFPHVVEPVRARNSAVNFVQGWARSIDFSNRTVAVDGSVTEGGVTEAEAVGESDDEDRGVKTRRQRIAEEKQREDGIIDLPYDRLVVSVGCISQTFGTKGVKDNALFLKDIGDARKIRRRILECYELAAMPNASPVRRRHLLNFAVVGGGPTGTEFAAVLSDLIREDMEKVYPALKGEAKVTVYDVAPRVLSMFDEALAKYAVESMRKEGVSVKTEHHIEELRWGEPNAPPPDQKDPKGPLTLKTKEEGEVGVGMVVWATGNAMNPFVEHSLHTIAGVRPTDLLLGDIKKGESGTNHENDVWQIKKHPKSGALLVDDHLRLQVTTDSGTTATITNVFALGDNAMIESGSPPATAQSANQEALWLAKRLNKDDLKTSPGFEFANKGVITYVGDMKGLVQTPDKTGDSTTLEKMVPDAIKGKTAYLAWKGAYWTMSISWRNRILILVYWAINRVFGRDISRF